jgi:hypothetical protein
MGVRPRFQPGKLLVQFKAGVTATQKNALLVKHGMTVARYPRLPGWYLLNVPVGGEEALAEELKKDPVVEDAEVDLIAQLH